MTGYSLCGTLVLAACVAFSSAYPGGGRVLHFPAPQNVLRWSHLQATTPNMDAFTICVWIKTIRTTSGPILSYGSERYPRSIELAYSPTGHGYSVILNGVRVLNGVPHAEAPLPADGNWHHMCVTWSSDEGEMNIYRDGLHALSRPVNSSYIPGGGDWIVGHTHTEARPGGYVKRPTFVGFVGGVNVWDRVKVDIPGMAICANTMEGSLVSWDTVTKLNFKVATYEEHC